MQQAIDSLKDPEVRRMLEDEEREMLKQERRERREAFESSGGDRFRNELAQKLTRLEKRQRNADWRDTQKGHTRPITTGN